MILIRKDTMADVWHLLLDALVYYGKATAPRNMQISEIIDTTFYIDNALNNIFVNDERKVAYRFMVAEWLWIWYGRDDVKTISRYNKNIAKFSDNGVDFNGAYGVPVKAQWPYLLHTLQNDRSTRQAVIQIYKPPISVTKDVPCTLTMQFLVRDHKLHTIVNMRSSDIWLGLPYDVFNFSMLANILVSQLNAYTTRIIHVGSLTMHLGSSHLYEKNRKQAILALAHRTTSIASQQLVVPPPDWLEDILTGEEKNKWEFNEQWEVYANVLCAGTNRQALEVLHAASV